MSEPRRIDATSWELPASRHGRMRVPARVFATERLIQGIMRDHSLEQLQNVATLPGIVDAAIGMPDIHQGYGFPVGGVAATDAADGVVSPGGVGYDINCGVRLLAAPIGADELGARKEAVIDELARSVPAGTGVSAGSVSMRARQLDRVLVGGARTVVEELGLGTIEDVERTESGGRLPGADPDEVSERARERGADQLGTLGSGNHFLELQRVERVFDCAAGEAFGLRTGALTVLIHSGSRGLGHQVCTDFVRLMDRKVRAYGIVLPDRQLSCAPIDSPEGASYLKAMAAAANFAFANRQAIAASVRAAFARVLGGAVADTTCQVYDVAHNVAKLESHGGRTLCVHRKGATRAFAAGADEIPSEYRAVGQPVLIPGSMGTSSFVLAGQPGALERSFGTTCHGAGRRLSRTAAKKQVAGEELRRALERAGIAVRAASNRGLAEEAPFAYKDVVEVVYVVERAGLAKRVAQLRPIAVLKG